jgi:hypothetical protein
MKLKLIISAFLMVLAFQNTSIADVLSGGLQDIEGKKILHAGQIEHFECAVPGKYNCKTWPKNLLQFEYKNICFDPGTDVCSIGCEGLIAEGGDKIPYFYTNGGYLENMKKYTVEYFKCPR